MNDISHSAGRYINHISKDIHFYYKHHLKEFDMGWGQFKIILLLMDQGGLKQEAISCKLEIDKTTVARTLKKMEISGLIIRKADPSDKRVHRVYLTPKAEKLEDFLTQHRQNINQKLLIGFSENEYILLMDFLIRLKDNSHSLLEEKKHESI